MKEPSEGVPPVVDTAEALAETVRRLREGTGAFAVDSERAAGFRYSQRAYLVQVRRAGSGTHLIDPIPLADGLDELREVMASDEWILHAASQDLPCLRELGLEPPSVFDTELAGRLLGRRLVGLGSMVEDLIGVSLAKEHSASDWSVRPISESGRAYAALDVEFLVPLRDLLRAELARTGKTEWAEQEFEHALSLPEAPPRPDPWRRTHQIGNVRTARGLAVVRELWTARDEIAQRLDIAPGRLVNDRAITALAARDPLPPELPNARDWRRHDPERWKAAYARALSLPGGELPPRRGPSRGGLPEPRSWPRVNPPAAARLAAVKEAVRLRAEALEVPQENLLSPATQRRIAWESTRPSLGELEAIASRDGARPWQIENVGAAITEALIGLAKGPASR
ncbi:MAG: ribonuclease D [bacterium]|nr:ribonuclease D [bacterium]